MKLLLELIISLVLHTIALVLTWVNIAGRSDLNTPQKIIWALVSIFWGIGPILYVIVGGGSLW